jgi:excinuclease UvrABC ATPase subunit
LNGITNEDAKAGTPHGFDPHSRRTHAQPQEPQSRSAAREADRHHGLSGSGKSSLAFDTLYAEGQRRYVESLSAYARQFLQLMEKPDVDLIEGLSPAISIEQKATSHNPRSTVGHGHRDPRLPAPLFARVGDPYCPTIRSRSSPR